MIGWLKRRAGKKPAREATREEVISASQQAFSDMLAATRVMLGDAENYLEMSFRCPVTDETFVARVQRADRLTPHAARMLAEADRDRFAVLLAEQEKETARLRAQVRKLLGEDEDEEPTR